MKLRTLAVWSVSGLLALSAQAFDLKGIAPGMSKADFVAKFGESPVRGLTIADIPSRHKTTTVIFDDNDRLSSLYFFFEADHFDDMRDAVKAKYPALRCTNSTVSNRLGAKFTQTNCTLNDSTGRLSLTRYNDTLDGSALTIYSREELEAIRQHYKNRKSKDI
ncbi:MAG: hypothetical protein K5880_22010 [Hydrogenophaga sp.]|jgi:hypothetical protein|uniref:hypothetical protein n=1 Tax=Hydrogenophaga sp. TaxID=1904254 RepID=UPI002610008D|nr:hypothetical protein [Hydrogenophaga sp.]MCV0441278.1 hypothetical protein [Hydrogenophaga sp.]